MIGLSDSFNSILPDQRVSFKTKQTVKWSMNMANYVVTLAVGSNDKARTARFLNMANGEVDKKMYEYVLKTYGLKESGIDKESILDKPTWTLIKRYKPSEAEAKAHAKAKPFKALDSVGYINPILSKFINKMVAHGVKATTKKDEHFVERKSNNTIMEHCSNDVLISLRLNNN